MNVQLAETLVGTSKAYKASNISSLRESWPTNMIDVDLETLELIQGLEHDKGSVFECPMNLERGKILERLSCGFDIDDENDDDVEDDEKNNTAAAAERVVSLMQSFPGTVWTFDLPGPPPTHMAETYKEIFEVYDFVSDVRHDRNIVFDCGGNSFVLMIGYCAWT
mmetsp:Transcript_9340/g.18228  ORF Transcript_9340/g.18228 Transcript_9340/m.18228 type:complete len:165 (+) Transcript_9340:389-883(+)